MEINALEEFLNSYNRYSQKNPIRCAHVYTAHEDFYLKENYTEKELDVFLNSLDFIYNNENADNDGNKILYLYGTVWLENYCQFTRDSYLANEFWHFQDFNEIPNYLRNEN